jgi:cob(I)alamin adenosyltransferase
MRSACCSKSLLNGVAMSAPRSNISFWIRRRWAAKPAWSSASAAIATPFGTDFEEHALRIVPGQVARIETEIDALNADLPPLTSFILPGGSTGVASLHLARAITRRAERSSVALAADDEVSPAALAYLNRLSDHLFVAARWVAAAEGGDVLWQPGATRNS